jgi:hypothetical protein
MTILPVSAEHSAREAFDPDSADCLGSSTDAVPLHIHLLRTEYLRRKDKNPRYSVRAFARSMGMHASAMCRTLRGKADLSVRASFQIIARMDLNEDERRAFVSSVANEKARRILAALRPAVRNPNFGFTREAQAMGAEV